VQSVNLSRKRSLFTENYKEILSLFVENSANRLTGKCGGGHDRTRVSGESVRLLEFTIFQYLIRSPTIRGKPRLNEDIRVSLVRVVNAEGEMLGEMATEDAMKMAKEAELDLVEINPDDTPPVCKIMDFGKVQYERRKKQTSGTKKTHQQQLKQIRLRAKTGQHDIDFKMKKVREFLGRKDKVKINVLFRGRENAHHERGREMLEEIGESLKDVAEIERAPFMESGRSMSMLVGPKP